MRRNAHVRFGGRPAETHPRKRGQGAAGRPYTYVPTWSGFCYTAFVTGPVLPPDRRLGHQQPHGAPTTRSAPWSRRSGRRKHREGRCLTGLVHHSDHGSKSPVHRLHRTTRRRGHRGIGRSRGLLLRRRRRRGPGQAPASAGPVLARRPLEGPRRPRDRHRPMGELVQPHPTPPRQPRRPLARRRRTPLPSQPHHHRRPARHGITNPATA